MAAQNGTRTALFLGTILVLTLWIAAIATPRWHTKLYFIAGGSAKAYLHVSLWSYRIECPTSSGGWLNGAAAAVAGATYCDALTAPRDLIELQANNPQDAVINNIVYGSLGCVAMAALALGCAGLGTTLIAARPGSKFALYFHIAGATLGLFAVVVYVGMTGNLDKFMDPDFLKGAAFVLNDANTPVTLAYSFWLALTAVLLDWGLVYAVKVYTDGLASGEAAKLLDGGWDPSWGPQQQQQWDPSWGPQQPQQQQQQQWQAPGQQWGAQQAW